MAFLIAISSPWNEVRQYLFQNRHRVSEQARGSYERFYGEQQRRLHLFRESLPRQLFPCDAADIERALEGGYVESVISLYALFHGTQMKLNRYTIYTDLSEAGLGRNLRAARSRARELLIVTQMVWDLYGQRASRDRDRDRDRDRVIIGSNPFRGVIIGSNPFHGCAILSAMDLLTSIGSLADLQSDLRLVRKSLGVLQELSRYWASARKQLDAMTVRFGDMVRALENGPPTGRVWFVTSNPVEDPFGRELDLLFSTPVEARLRALLLGLGLGTGMGTGDGGGGGDGVGETVLTIETVSPQL